MMTETHMYGRVFGEHHFGNLFATLALAASDERATFEALLAELDRHSVFFGCAAHPDVEDDILEEVWHNTLHNLGDSARRGARDDVQWYVTSQFLRTLRSARGLPCAPLDRELEALVESSVGRLAEALSWAYVPLREMFNYNQALSRHYAVNPQCFVELVDWTCTLLDEDGAAGREGESSDSDSAGLWSGYHLCRQEIDKCRRSASNPSGPVSQAAPSAGGSAPAVVLWAHDQDIALPAWRMLVDQRPMTQAELHDPEILARLTGDYAPPQDDPMGNGRFFTSAWQTIFVDDVKRAGILAFDASSVGREKRLPRLTEAALIVHILGLEAPDRRAILSRAIDSVLVHVLLPSARAIGASQNRHEPIPGYLVATLARILRPWSFSAPPLTTDQRIVLIHALAELATGTSRKLLHAEKKHAARQADPALIRRAVNRALARWPKCVHSLSPRRRIDRAAAVFRYLNRVRRGRQARARDIAIVAEMLRG